MVTEVPGVAVIGAGPIGFFTALCLARRGFTVSLFEAKSRSLFTHSLTPSTTDIDHNLILTSRGLNALNEVGLCAEVLKHQCVPLYGRQIHCVDDTEKYQPYGPDPSFCNYSINRSHLNAVLLEAAENAGVKTYWSHPIAHVNVEKKVLNIYLNVDSPFRTPPRLKYAAVPNKEVPQSVVQMIARGVGDGVGEKTLGGFKSYGISLKFSSIFACDGHNSRSRASLHNVLHSTVGVSASVATPFGHTLRVQTSPIATTTSSSPAAPNSEQQPPRQIFDFKSSLDISGSFDTAVPLGMGYLSLHLPPPDRRHDGRSDDGTKPTPPLASKCLHLWPRGRHFLMAIPNYDGSFVVTLFLPENDSSNDPSWNNIKTDQDILTFFNTHYPNIPIPNLVQQWANKSGPLGSHQCFPWHFRHHLVLLGDAAASYVPFFGQGLNSGLESALTLFQHLDYFARVKIPTTDNYDRITPFFNPEQCRKQYTPYIIAKAFSAMSSNHKVNTDAISAMSVENYIEMGISTPSVAFLRYTQYEAALVQHFPHQFLSRLTMITHTLIPYAVIYTLGEVQKSMIIKTLLEHEIATQGPLTQITLQTPPQIDLKLAKNLIDKKYQPILDKYNVTSHSMRDVTKELVLKALSPPSSQQLSTEAKL